MSSESSAPVSLESLIALNDEVAALCRAGIPLEAGLRAVADDTTGEAHALLTDVHKRLEAGEPIEDALGGVKSLPDVYRCVVQAGIRSGRLADALESVATTSKTVMEIRRRLTFALMYPAFLFAAAYALFVFFMVAIAPEILGTFTAFRLQPDIWITSLTWASSHVRTWAPFPPVIGLMLVLWWMWGARAAALSSRNPLSWRSVLSRAPFLGRVFHDMDYAAFCSLLAVLLEQDVPLDESVELAAGATDSAVFERWAAEVSHRLRQGDSLGEGLVATKAFSPLLRWMARSAERHRVLPAAMRQLSGVYRRRAERRIDWVQWMLPAVLVVVFGGTFVMTYALTVFLPLRQLIFQLGLE